MSVSVKVGSNHQITVPATIRKQLQIKSGDRLLVDVRDGYLVVIPEPDDYSQRLRGLHREIWQDVDPREYIRRERDAWQD